MSLNYTGGMNAFEKEASENGKSSGCVKNSSRDRPEVVGKLNDAEEVVGESKSVDVLMKTDEEDEPDLEVPKKDVLLDHVKDDRQSEQEKEGQKDDAEEQIGFLDHVDEQMIKPDNTFMSISDHKFDEDVIEYMKSLGVIGSVGNVELNILKMPNLDIVTAETKTIRESRRIAIYPLSLVDMSHGAVRKILASESCVDFMVKCNRTGDCKAWNGCAILTFLTSSDATAAAGELRQIREGLNVEQGSSVDSKFAEQQSQNLPKEDWTEAMLMVKNIGYSITEDALKEIFPDADVVIHKNYEGGSSRGHAYLLYSSAVRAKEVLETYSAKKLEINGRRLMLLGWRETMQYRLPDGMLRIGERRLVMQNLDEMKTKREKSQPTEYQQAKINFLQALVDRDNGVRKLYGMPLPSYDQLKKLSGLHQLGEFRTSHILNQLLEPFYKERKKAKDKARDREIESKREKEHQRNQESTANHRLVSRSKKAASDSDKSSLKRQPIRLLSIPIPPTKRKIGVGKQQQQQQHQQQRTAMVRPLLSTQLSGKRSYDFGASRDYDDEEPRSKTCRYSSMDGVEDEDQFSQNYTHPDHRVHRAEEYDDGQPWRHYRDDSGDRGDDLYRCKELLSSAFRSLDTKEFYRDERSAHRNSESHQDLRGLLGSAPVRMDEGRRGKYRMRCDEREERRVRDNRGRSSDRLSRQEVDSSRRQDSSSSRSAKADPVGLLLNLSQLLTEKLQRFKKKEKGKRG